MSDNSFSAAHPSFNVGKLLSRAAAASAEAAKAAEKIAASVPAHAQASLSASTSSVAAASASAVESKGAGSGAATVAAEPPVAIAAEDKKQPGESKKGDTSAPELPLVADAKAAKPQAQENDLAGVGASTEIPVLTIKRVEEPPLKRAKVDEESAKAEEDANMGVKEDEGKDNKPEPVPDEEEAAILKRKKPAKKQQEDQEKKKKKPAAAKKKPAKKKDDDDDDEEEEEPEGKEEKKPKKKKKAAKEDESITDDVKEQFRFVTAMSKIDSARLCEESLLAGILNLHSAGLTTKKLGAFMPGTEDPEVRAAAKFAEKVFAFCCQRERDVGITDEDQEKTFAFLMSHMEPRLALSIKLPELMLNFGLDEDGRSCVPWAESSERAGYTFAQFGVLVQRLARCLIPDSIKASALKKARGKEAEFEDHLDCLLAQAFCGASILSLAHVLRDDLAEYEVKGATNAYGKLAKSAAKEDATKAAQARTLLNKAIRECEVAMMVHKVDEQVALYSLMTVLSTSGIYSEDFSHLRLKHTGERVFRKMDMDEAIAVTTPEDHGTIKDLLFHVETVRKRKLHEQVTAYVAQQLTDLSE